MVIFPLTLPGAQLQKAYNDNLQMVIINLFYYCLSLFGYHPFMFWKWHISHWKWVAYGLLSFPYHISLLIPLPGILLVPYLPWVNNPQGHMCNNLLITSSDMEGITRAKCKLFRGIFQLFSLASSDTWRSFPSIWTCPGCSHSCLQSKSTAMYVPDVQSLPLIF